MTITVTSITSGPYFASGQTTFPVSFQSAGGGEVEVLLDNVVVSPSEYTFYRDPDGTGEVVFSAPVSGVVMIVSDPAFNQPTAYNRHGAFYPDQINTPLDRGAAKDLWLRDGVTRAVRVPAGEESSLLPPASERANKIMGFDGAGNPIVVDGIRPDDGILDYGIRLFDDNEIDDKGQWAADFANITDLGVRT